VPARFPQLENPMSMSPKVGVRISKRLALTNSAASAAGMLLNAAVTFWLQQYLLRRIGAEEYSLISVLSAVMVFLPLVTAVLTSGIGRYIVEAYAEGDEERVTQIVSTMFPILFLVSILVSILAFFAVRYVYVIVKIESAQVQPARIMLSVMMFSFILRLVLSPFASGLYVRQRFVLQNVINFCITLFKGALLLFLLLAVSTSVVWVIVAQTTGDLIGFCIIVSLSRRMVPSLSYRRGKFRWNLVRSLVSFGGWNAIGQIGGMIRSAADPLILNRLATPVDVASFNLGAQADRMIRHLISTALHPVQPQMTAMYAKNRDDMLSAAFLRLGRFAMWASMLMIVPLIVFRQEFFQVYLRERFQTYVPATVVMPLLLSYLPIAYSITGLDQIVVATAKNRGYMVFTSLSQLLNLILTFFFVATLHMGAVGSALATFCAGAAVTLFAFFPLAMKLTKLKVREYLRRTLLPGIAPAIAGMAAWILLRTLVTPSTWLELCLCVLCGVVVYLLVLVAWCLQPKDRTDLNTVYQALKSRFAK
jgi:O-antigen/teichoic acid export membrane protein